MFQENTMFYPFLDHEDKSIELYKPLHINFIKILNLVVTTNINMHVLVVKSLVNPFVSFIEPSMSPTIIKILLDSIS